MQQPMWADMYVVNLEDQQIRISVGKDIAISEASDPPSKKLRGTELRYFLSTAVPS